MDSELVKPTEVAIIPPGEGTFLAVTEAPGEAEPGAESKGGWSDQALALDKAQDWQSLLAWCRRWTQAEPGNGGAWFGLGVAYGKLDRYREAIAAYRELLRLEPNAAVAWYNLGGAYGDLSRHQEEIAAYPGGPAPKA
ncbi:MAG: tetratricopeptide repeat protein [Desulfobaccales bacterium]